MTTIILTLAISYPVILIGQPPNPPVDGTLYTASSGPMTVQCRVTLGRCVFDFPAPPVGNFIAIQAEGKGVDGVYLMTIPTREQPKRRAARRK